MLWVCGDCTARYSVGAPRCPQCGSTNHQEDGMAKISLHGGPSNAAVDIPVDDLTGRQPLEVQRATDPTGTVETEADRVDREHQAALEAAGEQAPEQDSDTDQGGDPSSQPPDQAAGMNSSASSESPATSSLPAPTSSGSSAPTTGNHSAPEPTEASTAPSTATDPVPSPLGERPHP